MPSEPGSARGRKADGRHPCPENLTSRPDRTPGYCFTSFSPLTCVRVLLKAGLSAAALLTSQAASADTVTDWWDVANRYFYAS